MANHSTSKLLLTGFALMGILLASGCSKKNDGSGSYSPGKLEAFPLVYYLQSPGSLQGNRYQMKAQIDRQLGWKQGVGRLILVQTTTDDGLSKKVPVFIRDGVGQGVLPGQKFMMTVLVGEDNLVIVENYEKY